ncbi:MAG: SDR family oxidoreductase [Gordonia sp. (in: high G+C Gram-positive bacteria)]|uniref:SDR family NAD(P)-dependent oxidoreductase n=1 Tax=Gordonia sp. (in: high G+C Gram-positive bacteria) TaxID=84139 RepID=UPI0039E4FF8D
MNSASTIAPCPGRLDGRIALITGGSRGQGAAHGARLSAEGATVYLADVLDDEGEATAAALRESGADVTYLRLDVTDQQQWTAAHDRIAGDHGRLDVLVNNAGIVHVTPLEEETAEAWNRLLAVNLTGAFLGLRTMLGLLRASSVASVINTSSIFGPSGAIGYAAYAASKSGLLGLTRTAALEFAADGIRVNALVPGGVATPLNANEPGTGVVPETPLGRRADPAELAAAVAFLASDDARFMTGSELVVDGGFRAR